jgi:acetyltransferase-like isoleucine patch superfamily enzyme
VTPLVIPREVAADDVVSVRAWLAPHGAMVAADAEVAEVTTSKATVVIATPRAGYLAHACAEGDWLRVGDRLGAIHDLPPHGHPPPATVHRERARPDPVISRAAQALMDRHGLDAGRFAGWTVVREQDVVRVLQPAADADPRALGALVEARRRTMRARHDRHVPTGTLLNDRWQLARDLGFGDGTSVYDECLVLGDVVLGARCWVGPFTVLDGSRGPLRVGDHTQIGTGAQLYTHHSIERCLTGGRAAPFGAPTTIGRCCFIGPTAVIGAGTVLGDHCFVAAGSYVEGHFRSYSYLAGAPARRVGRVEVNGDRARVIRDAD